jgi:large subunit ribosomal protein MRP49
MNNGHMGPRKFWKDILPRLKYHNPQLPMVVNRHSDNERKPTMTIYVRDKSADASAGAPAPIQPASSWNDLSKAQPPAAGERVITIDMKDRHSSQILEYLIAETRAVPLKPTPEQVEEMQSLEQLSQQSKTDRARVLSDRMEKKREEDMLKRARAAGGLADADA